MKTLWRGWVAFGHFLGRINTALLLTFIYFLVVPVVGLFVRFKDPLRASRRSESFWEEHKPVEKSLRRHTMQF